MAGKENQTNKNIWHIKQNLLKFLQMETMEVKRNLFTFPTLLNACIHFFICSVHVWMYIKEIVVLCFPKTKIIQSFALADRRKTTIIILIFKACWQHWFLWLSLAIHFYQQSFLVSPLDGIQCLHRTDECKFLRVSQHWCAHV